ncbi:KDO2-lipid IV(A) lauroyltransferase [Dysgonomonas sp. PH5-45]|uniref:lysophospholipid acyltransferase family protein n=1 Tax=unclassified Dysgonomonas TaxID=2630389 RepID=UPI002475D467|nr:MULTISPECIES: lysophospholipid acyltransferase family protein [unclassified Dysgonomonas]MDH6355283.1 KDO2-lipid IV(A) lauroyltransferase [Dysgonomonas sp. PH5-45]MDH6388191.1 KDO2-lipid IV(A) lauroyltransferase [Dysgonomonas sp. PH5-37]
MLTKLTYGLLYSWMMIHAVLPFRLLYVLSDILYVVVYKIVGYRRKVVRGNLRNSFPDKSDRDLMQIEKDFYHHFCDYFVETIKLLHVSDKEIQSRIRFKNPELVRELTRKGNSVLMYLGHYGNWEWVPAMTLLMDADVSTGDIYRPLKNKAVDDIFLKIRSRFGALNIPKNNTLRAIVKMRQTGKKVVVGFMSDQTPSVNNIHYWTTFLNQDTAVFTGVERIAKTTGFAVIYLDMEKVGRGRYDCTYHLITETPKEDPEFQITEKYIRIFEQTILRNPAYWLWTHKRWKYKKSDFVDKE